MSRKAERTIGTKLSKKMSGSETEDLIIGNLTSIGEIGLESEEIDVTDLDSPNDFKEFIGGFKDAGEVSLEGFMETDATVVAMYTLANSRSVEDWVVTYPNGAKWEFSGFVKSFKDMEKSVEGVAKYTSVIRISGAPTYTVAPST